MGNEYFILFNPKVRVRTLKSRKKKPAQPEWLKQDRKIFRRCMSRSPYKPRRPSERTRSPCYGEFPRPTDPDHEGAYAIKVSMRCAGVKSEAYILPDPAHGPMVFVCTDRSIHMHPVAKLMPIIHGNFNLSSRFPSSHSEAQRNHYRQ